MEDHKPNDDMIEKIQRKLEEADKKLEEITPGVDRHHPGWEPESDYAGPGDRPMPPDVEEAHEDDPELAEPHQLDPSEHD